MSDIELSVCYEQFLNHSININYNSLSQPDIETISKTRFAEHYHLLCKICGKIPEIEFLKAKKIKFKCDCRDLLINNIHKIYDYLDYSEIIGTENIKLKCEEHFDEKYSNYCTECGINICNKCAIRHINHEDKIKVLTLYDNAADKRKYIIEKIKDKNQTYIDDENHTLNKDFTTEDDNCNEGKTIKIIEKDSENNIDNDKSEEDEAENLISENKNIITNETKDKIKNEIIDAMNKNNNDESSDEEYYLINLFAIIADDFQNYPNYKLNEIISNLEKFIILYIDNFQKIELKYEFEKEDIKEDLVNILGEKFVKNNKEKCFLAINEKLMDINNSIDLKDIYDYYNLNLFFWPMQLNVELVERQDNKITDLSYMFCGISNLMSTSNFNYFDSSNITNAEFMFYNCSSIKELPDISNLKFSNITNMRYMFSGCKFLKQLPDISKWNTNKLINIESMFENCESLISLPDISNWNKNNNITNKRRLFLNCKSLENIGDLTHFFTEEELANDDIFAGCTKLEEKNKKNNVEKEVSLSERLGNMFINSIGNCFKFGCYGILAILYIIIIIGLIYYTFFHIYISFNLDKSREFFNDQEKYSYLINYTNISHIAIVKNITNPSKLKEINENKEDFIKSEMNFTYINGNVTFESSQKYLKIYSIIIVSVLFLNILFNSIIFIMRNKLGPFQLTKLIRFLHITIFIFIINIIDLIIEINDILIIKNFTNSFEIYNKKLQKLFKNKFKGDILKEYNSLSNSFESIIVNIVISVLFILLYNYILELIIKRKKEEEENNSFERNKNIILSNINNQI